MIEQGLVLDVREGRAKVEMQPRRGSCCGGCSFCTATGEGRTLELDASPGLQPGDRVKVRVPVRSAVIATVVLFAVPLLLLVGGVMAGAYAFPAAEATGQVNLFALLVGTVLALLWYGGVWLVERGRGERPDKVPQIVEVVHSNGPARRSPCAP